MNESSEQAGACERGQAKSSCPIVAVGASAGGLEAFKAFFSNVPADSGLAFVLVQHLSPDFPTSIPEILGSWTKLPVRLVTEPVEVEPNHIYVIAPNSLLTISQCTLQPSARTDLTAYRHPIDQFFRSVAEEQAELAVGIVLSGAGSDGAIGLQSIKKQGGQTIAQSPDTCRYDSMPRAAIATGMVDHVLPPEAMASQIAAFFKYRTEVQSSGETGIAETLGPICTLLYDRLGHDFSRYKRSTLIRRVERRMQMLRLRPVSAYLELLEKEPAELEQLFKDLLISVTEFFRDREAFEVLARRVIPKLFQQAGSDGTIRVWVPGCATGQEVYSIAILLKEQMARTASELPVQIFATDIDGEALEIARQAFYGEDIVDQVSRERLSRYFRKQSGGYRLSKEIREMCVFSMHNLVADPPFSRMDLVSCRNVLIYFDSALQQKVIPLFHYALRSGGYLFLGPAESLGPLADSFLPIEKRLRIFQAKPSALASVVRMPRTDGTRSNRLVADTSFKMRISRERDAKELHERALLDWYAPPSVLVDANGEILHFIRRTSRFLEPPVGAPSHNIYDLVRDSLRMVLRSAMNQSRQEACEVIRKQTQIEQGDDVLEVSLIVRPIKEGEGAPEHFLIVFQEESEPRPRDTPVSSSSPPDHAGSIEVVQQLERELRSTKECLQSTIEELENSNEELKSSNEELISINEEYQSANESLQTSKEELQSLNEELETLNSELSKKVEELDRSNFDMQNLFASTAIASIFLDGNLRIKKFTPAAIELFNLIESDLDRPLEDITAKFDFEQLRPVIEAANQGKAVLPVELLSKDNNRWFLARVTPYRIADAGHDGVVASFVDVTDLKRAEATAHESLVENEKLYDIGMALASELDLERLLQKITDIATSLTKAQFGAFFYNAIGEHGESFMLYTISGVPKSAFEQFPMPRNTAVFDATFKGAGPVRADDITKDPRYGKNSPYRGMPPGHLPVVSYLAVPVLGRGGEVIGGLFFGHGEPGIFDELAERRALAIAGQAASAVDNARMFDNLRKTARALDESERRFRQLADSMPQIVWTARPDGYVDYYNRRWYEFTGITEATGGDESFVPVLHEDDVQRCLETWYHAVRTGIPYEIRYRFRDLKSGDCRWHLGRALPQRDESGNIVKWFGTSTDIDDLVKAEAALKEAADRKDEFLAMLGHELRNPLAPVKTALQLLCLPETSAEEASELMEMLGRQTSHLTRIIDDLLDVSRISRGKVLLQKKPVDLVALIQSAVRDHRISLHGLGLTLHLEIPSEPVWVDGDATRICQIFSNLFQNACKFTDSGGEVHISLVQNGESAELTFADTGMGMSAATLERLFQPFNQADTSMDRSRGGLGLGLALIKGLVELHGGQVSASSGGLGEGSKFVVTLPVTEKRTLASPSPPPGLIPSHRIVIIEDNADAAETLGRLLKRRGHQVATASYGEEGISIAREHRAQVVLCDIGLPGDLDGYSVARRLRAEWKEWPLLLIALTGYGQEQDRQVALDSGFDVHFTKPVSLEQIEEALAGFQGLVRPE